MQVIRQESKRDSALHFWSRTVGIIVSAFVFAAGPVQALPIESATSGFFYSTGLDSDGLATTWFTHSGFDSLGNKLVCSTVAESVLVEPTGACALGEIELALLPDTLHSHCRAEGTSDIFNYTGTGTGCVPLSCLDDDEETICSIIFRGTSALVGGNRLAAGSSGSFTYTQTFTYTDPLGGTVNQKTEGNIEFAVPPPTEANNKLIAAVQAGNIAEVIAALREGASVNVRNAGAANETPLFYAQSPEIAALLLHVGAAVNVRNDYGMTPLHDASISGHIEIVWLLLEAGAAPYARDERGWTPLDWVEERPWGVSQASDELIQLLKNAGG